MDATVLNACPKLRRNASICIASQPWGVGGTGGSEGDETGVDVLCVMTGVSTISADLLAASFSGRGSWGRPLVFLIQLINEALLRSKAFSTSDKAISYIWENCLCNVPPKLPTSLIKSAMSSLYFSLAAVRTENTNITKTTRAQNISEYEMIVAKLLTGYIVDMLDGVNLPKLNPQKPQNVRM